MVAVLDVILEVLNKKESFNFKKFLGNYPNITSWYMISDYCLEDTNKYNDVFTFSLLLNIEKIDGLKAYINKHAPTDLKKTKMVSDGLLDLINSEAVYHFSVLIPRNEKLLAGLCSKAGFSEILDYMTMLVENTKIAYPSRKEYYDGMLKRMRLLKNDMLKSSFNEKLLRKIFVTRLLGSAIIYMLKVHSNPTHIAWISDRDAIG